MTLFLKHNPFIPYKSLLCVSSNSIFFLIASRFWIAVKQKNTSNKPKPEKKECIGTMLCMLTCKSGYQLGKTGPDGCQACTCLKHGKAKTLSARRLSSYFREYELKLNCLDTLGVISNIRWQNNGHVLEIRFFEVVLGQKFESIYYFFSWTVRLQLVLYPRIHVMSWLRCFGFFFNFVNLFFFFFF